MLLPGVRAFSSGNREFNLEERIDEVVYSEGATFSWFPKMDRPQWNMR
jgi:hypothetical protein